MAGMFEFLIWDREGNERRVRVSASSEEAAWSLLPLKENESASIATVASKPQSTNNQPETSYQGNDDGFTTPKLEDPIGLFESIVYLYIPGSIIESERIYLESTKTRPHALLPGSSTARALLSVLIWAVTVTQTVMGIIATDSGDLKFWQAALFYPILSVASWVFLIAVFRFAFVIYPWERRNNAQ